GREDLPGPTAPAFDEELLRVAFADEELHVGAEDRLVELVVVEGAADEVRAGAAKQRTERPERQVDAGGDVRWAHKVEMEEVGQDHVVEVAAGGRPEHRRVLVHGRQYLVEPRIFEALEEARPDAI